MSVTDDFICIHRFSATRSPFHQIDTHIFFADAATAKPEPSPLFADWCCCVHSCTPHAASYSACEDTLCLMVTEVKAVKQAGWVCSSTYAGMLQVKVIVVTTITSTYTDATSIIRNHLFVLKILLPVAGKCRVRRWIIRHEREEK